MRRPTRLAAAFLVAVCSLAVAAPAHADSVSAKQNQANKIAAQLDALEEQAASLDEDLNQAQIELQQVESDVGTAKAQVGAHDAELATLRDQLSGFAVNAYVNSGTTGGISGLIGGTTLLDGAAQREGYAAVASGQTADLADEAGAVREDADIARKNLTFKLTRQQQLTATLEAKRKAVDDALAKYTALQAQVQGDLVDLVAQARLNARNAAAAKAREVARRAAQGGQSTGTRGTTKGAKGTTKGTKGVPGAGRNVPPPSPGAAGAVAAAKSQLGVPYHFLAMAQGVGFDCSGLTAWAWGRAGVSLPHSSRAQFAMLTKVTPDEAQPGDLFFYGSPIHHVALYVGGGQVIEAPFTGRNVGYGSAFRGGLVGIGRPR